jgi:hypothetical protein
MISTMRLGLALLAAVGALAGLSAASTAAPAATTVCYQLRGPHAKWLLPASVARAAGVPRTVAGTTWTAFATGTACRPKASAKYLLAKYPAARRAPSGAIRPPLKGFTVCATTSVGEVGCVGSNDKTFTLLETGQYSLSQIKQLAAAGRLPIR